MAAPLVRYITSGCHPTAIVSVWLEKMWREGFHVAALLHHAITSWYAIQIDTSQVTDPYVKQATTTLSWRFFSGWTFAIQVLFLVLAVLEDTLQGCLNVGVAKLRLHIAEVKDYIFETFVVPLSAATVLMFWLLYSIDRELIFPPAFDPLVSRWLNHAVHTNIILVVLLELVLSKHQYRDYALALRDIAVYLVIYDLCFLYTYFYDGVYLYPVYVAMSNWFQRVLYMAFGHVMVVGFYFLGSAINSLLWADHRRRHTLKGQLKEGLKGS